VSWVSAGATFVQYASLIERPRIDVSSGRRPDPWL
jgi:hypothetical protein